MMLRALIFVAIALLIAFAASWLSVQEGVSTITWLGYRGEINSSLLVVFIAAFGIGIVLIDRILRALLALPHLFSAGWQERRRHKGETALSLGFVALAAGDSRAAHRQARRAEKLLDKGILTDLLVAQSSSASGDAKAASRYFKKLAAAPETAYFGQLGLMRLYQQDSDSAESAKLAYGAAVKAFALDATSAEAAQVILRKALQGRQWGKALDCLKVYLNQSGGQSASEVAKARALYARLSLQMAEEVLAPQMSDDQKGSDYQKAPDNQKAIALCEQALSEDPHFVPATALLVRLLLEKNDKKAAVKKATAWFTATPHADSLALLRAAKDDNNGLFISAAMRLAPKSTMPDEVYLAVASFAISAGIWASASQALSQISGGYERHNQFYMIEAAIASGLDDEAGHNEALAKAARAPRARGWHCANCGTSAVQYQFDCGGCGAPGQMRFAPTGQAIKIG